MLNGKSLAAFLVAALSIVMFNASTVRAADELVDNPQYQAWAKFKPGTMVKYSFTSEAMGQKNDGDMTQTLTSVTPEKVVVEMKMSMMPKGQTMEYPAKVAKDAVQTPGQPKGTKPENVKTGKETVEVGGKSYDCMWTEFTGEQNGMKIAGKSWLSDEIPGKLLKMETSTSGAMTSSTKMTMAELQMK